MAQTTENNISARKAIVETGKFYSFFKRTVWAFAAVVVLISMLVLLKANGLYPFGKDTLAWCDMDQQVVPLLLQFKDVLAGKEGFFFSFKNAGGMNFYGVFFFFLASPFTFLVVFIDKADVSSFANVLILLKMCAIAATSALYLTHRNKNAPFLALFLSVLYAYSGYTMMYYQNLIWLDTAYLFPLLTLGLDKLKSGGRAPFIAALTACMFVNYYIGYMIVIFLLLYAFLWLILMKDKRFAANFFLSCAVAALLSAVVWLPSFVQYFSSGRKTDILSGLVRSSLITHYATAFPTVFSVLFLFPFALSYKRSEGRQGLFWLLLFIASLLPVIFEPINKMWQTGSYMAFPTRYAFITIFLCIVIAFDKTSCVDEEKSTEKHEGKMSLKNKNAATVYLMNALLIALSAAYFLFAIEYTQSNREIMDNYSHSLWGNKQSFFALLTLYGAALGLGTLFFVFKRLKLFKPSFLWASIAILALSELYVAPVTYMLTPAHETEQFRQIVELADKIDDDEFYRVTTSREFSEKGFHVNMMGGIGYNALGHYTSLTNGEYMSAIKRWGYTSYWMEVGNSGGTALSDALLSVKYRITDSKSEDGSAAYVGEKYSIVPTAAYLPLGIITAQDIVRTDCVYENRTQFQKLLAEEILGESGLVSEYRLENAEYYDLTVESGENGYKLTPTGADARIVFSAEIKEKTRLYFNAFHNNTNALKQPINEKFEVSAPKYRQSSYPLQKKNGLLNLGEYQNRTVRVTVRVKSEVVVRELGLAGIKTQVLKNAVARAETVGLKQTKNGLVGSFTASGGECVFLSVPYEGGMRLTINGRKADLFRAYGGFSAFYLQPGENEISVSFQPQGFALGIRMGVFGILAGVAATCFAFIKKRKFTLSRRMENAAYYVIIGLGACVLFAVYVLPTFLCIF